MLLYESIWDAWKGFRKSGAAEDKIESFITKVSSSDVSPEKVIELVYQLYEISRLESIPLDQVSGSSDIYLEFKTAMSSRAAVEVDSHDVRLLRHVGVLITKHDRPEDIERKVLTLRKFKRFDNTEWDR